MRKRLRAERLRLRMTQAEMADYLQITQASYSTIECGHRSGKGWIWDRLERLLRVDQAVLKENSEDEERQTIRSVGRNV